MEGLVRVPVREQEPKVRATNFEEVCYGYNEEEAVAEASRCLNCKNAQCMKGWPVLSIFRHLSHRSRSAILRRLIILSPSLPHFRLSVDVSAHRRASVKVNVSAVSRVIRLPSVN